MTIYITLFIVLSLALVASLVYLLVFLVSSKRDIETLYTSKLFSNSNTYDDLHQSGVHSNDESIRDSSEIAPKEIDVKD